MTQQEYKVTQELITPHIMNDVALVQSKLREYGYYSYKGLDLHEYMANWSDSALCDYLTAYTLDKHYHENNVIVDEL